MPNNPELPKQPSKVVFVPPSPEAAREAVRKIEEDVASDIARSKALTPPWHPLMDQIQIGVPGQISPNELDQLRWTTRPKRIRE
jgi:hypothetical protein